MEDWFDVDDDMEWPGMWERADVEGGLDETRGPDWTPPSTPAACGGGVHLHGPGKPCRKRSSEPA